MTLKELVEKRAAVVAQGRAIVDRAGAEKRDCTTEEQRHFDDLMRQADDLKEQIARMGRLEGHEDVLSQTRGRKSVMQRADRPGDSRVSGDVHVAEPGEVRMLTKDERLSDIYPASDEFGSIDLGRLIGVMAGRHTGPAALERRALATFGDSTGGFACPESVSRQIIDAARNQARCIQAGALTFQMDAQKVRVSTLDTEPEGQWKPEGLDADEDNCELGAIEF